jgi:hypothetical protein
LFTGSPVLAAATLLRDAERRRGDAQLGDAYVDERDAWISSSAKEAGAVRRACYRAIVTKREDLVAAHVSRLTTSFDAYVAEYDRRNPFDASGQLSGHVRTLTLRAEAGSATAALDEPAFMRSLYDTIRAWGIGVRGSVLVTYPAFERALRLRVEGIAALEGQRIDDPSLDVGRTKTALWTLIDSLGIVENKTPLVSGSKTLHHLLPDLVPPMDREYTRPFFGWYSSQFQQQQERVFREAFGSFWRVAVRVEPARLVADGWRTSSAKILDNAVVGFCLTEGIRRS